MTAFKTWADSVRAQAERTIARNWALCRDDPSFDQTKIGVDETDSGCGSTQSNPVDPIIEQLDRRLVPAPDRTRLRKALDTADAPLAGRAGQDQALGRIAGW